MTNVPTIAPPPTGRKWRVVGGAGLHAPRVFIGPLAECVKRAGPTDRVVPA
jgi:hypothetical protein